MNFNRSTWGDSFHIPHLDRKKIKGNWEATRSHATLGHGASVALRIPSKILIVLSSLTLFKSKSAEHGQNIFNVASFLTVCKVHDFGTFHTLVKH